MIVNGHSERSQESGVRSSGVRSQEFRSQESGGRRKKEEE